MEQINDLVEFYAVLQKNQQELDRVTAAIKDMPPLQCMLKMGENNKLQSELQQLRTQEEEYLKTVQPWQKEVSTNALQVNSKLTNFKATQTTVASLLEELATAELVDTTRECVEKMDKDLTGLIL